MAESSAPAASIVNPFEFYETPETYTRYLVSALAKRGIMIRGRILEPTVGSGAIVRAVQSCTTDKQQWFTNDIDPSWTADFYRDARAPDLYGELRPDCVIGNPPFKPAIEIIESALAHTGRLVAMHLRASIHEVTKTGVRRTWMAEHPPTAILWLPRFAFQRSPSTGDWATDSVTTCWLIWLRGDAGREQFIEYAPEWVLKSLDAETPHFRKRMDLLMEARSPGYFDVVSALQGKSRER